MIELHPDFEKIPKNNYITRGPYIEYEIECQTCGGIQHCSVKEDALAIMDDPCQHCMDSE